MKKNIPFFLFLLFVSCKSEDKIEFYLLKDRAPIKDGIPYLEVITIKDSVKRKEYEYVNYDTVFKEPIYAGRFEIDFLDLQPEPFITNNEIISFNVKSNKFEFTPSVAERLSNLSSDMHKGAQFAITVNKKPKLTGYFKHMSVGCDWYYIMYWDYKKEWGANNRNIFELFNGSMRGKHEDLTPPYSPELINAFRSTGRLIE